MVKRKNELDTRTELLRAKVEELLRSPYIRFDAQCRAALPAEPGVYRIFDPAEPANTIRAGRSKARGGLRQRLYQNHLMGGQPGNLGTNSSPTPCVQIWLPQKRTCEPNSQFRYLLSLTTANACGSNILCLPFLCRAIPISDAQIV